MAIAHRPTNKGRVTTQTSPHKRMGNRWHVHGGQPCTAVKVNADRLHASTHMWIEKSQVLEKHTENILFIEVQTPCSLR